METVCFSTGTVPAVPVVAVENFSENVEKFIYLVGFSWNLSGVCSFFGEFAEISVFPTIFPTVTGEITLLCGRFSKEFSTTCAKLEGRGGPFGAEGRKMTEGHFSILCPTRTAHKRTRRSPLMNHPDQRKNPLDTSRSGDSALRPQTNSGLPAFISFGRDKIWVQTDPNRKFSTDSGDEIATFTRLAYFNFRLCRSHMGQDSLQVRLNDGEVSRGFFLWRG